MLVIFIIGAVFVIGLWAVVIICFVSEPWTDYTNEMRRSVAIDRREARNKAICAQFANGTYYRAGPSNQPDDPDPGLAGHMRFVDDQTRQQATGFEFGGYSTAIPDNPTEMTEMINPFDNF